MRPQHNQSGMHSLDVAAFGVSSALLAPIRVMEQERTWVAEVVRFVMGQQYCCLVVQGERKGERGTPYKLQHPFCWPYRALCNFCGLYPLIPTRDKDSWVLCLTQVKIPCGEVNRWAPGLTVLIRLPQDAWPTVFTRSLTSQQKGLQGDMNLNRHSFKEF